jgi:hypothetical protein
MVFQHEETVWFKDDGSLTLTLCEDGMKFDEQT